MKGFVRVRNENHEILQHANDRPRVSALTREAIERVAFALFPHPRTTHIWQRLTLISSICSRTCTGQHFGSE